jgi:hypothetical protein
MELRIFLLWNVKFMKAWKVEKMHWVQEWC